MPRKSLSICQIVWRRIPDIRVLDTVVRTVDLSNKVYIHVSYDFELFV